MLAHDEGRLRLLPALQQSAGTKIAVSQPQLARLGTRHQRPRHGTLALVRILARHNVRDQGLVGVVDHQGVSGQGRAALTAQRRQSFLARGQMVAAQLRHDRRQTGGAALHQRAQHRRLRAIDLVVQRRQRHGQMLHLARCCMQRRAQPQRDQHHQLHHAGHHQLARVLPLAAGLEHLVDPACRQRLLQRHTRHHAHRRMLFKPLQYF